jgi:hypothetical protein
MIPVHSRANVDVGVFGLARSGLSSVRALRAGGAGVFAWDDSAAARKSAEREGARIAPFCDWPWNDIKTLVLSPGIPLTHPKPHEIVQVARAAGVEIVGDVELFAREIRRDRTAPGRAPVIAVTGTNGKSTTTALIGHILSCCGFAPEVGGNIGKPVLDLAPPNGRTVYVIEMSSYQIDLSPGLVPDVSVLTNITPDHIDRHGSLEGYIAVKTRLLEQTAGDGNICIGVDDPLSAAIHTRFPRMAALQLFLFRSAKYWVVVSSLLMACSMTRRRLARQDPGFVRRRSAAGRAQLAERRAGVCRYATFRQGRAHDRGRHRDISWSVTSNRRSRSRRQHSLRQRLQGDQRRRRRESAGMLFRYFLDPGRQVQGRRHRKPCMLLPAHPQGLSDRRGGAPFGATRSTAKCSTKRLARSRMLSRPPSRMQVARPAISQWCFCLRPALPFDQFRDFEARGDAFRALVQDVAAHPVREAS